MCSCLRYCKSTSFQANHNYRDAWCLSDVLFAILQKYEFSSKSQPMLPNAAWRTSCLRYCKSTSFQANHNLLVNKFWLNSVVCDTAKVRVFKQITTKLFKDLSFYCCLRYCKSTSFHANHNYLLIGKLFSSLFAILQKYEFSSKSQLPLSIFFNSFCCLRYCKSTSFQANHNLYMYGRNREDVVCDTAKVRVSKQITTKRVILLNIRKLFAILQMYEFSSKPRLKVWW